jgi:O-antigen ligase
MVNLKSYINISFISVYKKFHELLRFSLFTIFFLLSIRFVFSYLFAAPTWMITGGCFGIFFVFILCWWKLLLCLFLFIITIPIVSGIQSIGIMDGIPLFSFSFSCIYIAWFLKRIFYQKNTFEANNITDVLVDIFVVVIITSLIMSLSRYPIEFVKYRLQFASVLRQNDPFWCLEASQIILQGLFLYRIFSIECKTQNWLELIDKIFFFQTVSLIAFSSSQFFLQLINIRFDQIRIFWPFDDIHSYGSYVVFLFFYHISQVVFRKRNNKFSLFASILLLIFIIVSYSRATWLAFLMLSIILIFLILSRQKKIWFLLSVLIVFCSSSYLLGPALLESNNGYFYRLGRLISVKNYANDKTVVGRLDRWKIALRIINDFPLTGSGIGTYMRLAPSYYLSLKQDNQLIKKHNQKWSKNNAHNYYLQLWAEIGSIGLILFFSILICVYKIGLNVSFLQDKKKPQICGLLLGLSAYLITMITSHPLIISKHQFLFWFIISAIVLSCADRKEKFMNSKIGTIVLSLPVVLLVVLLPGYILNAKTIEEIEGVHYEYGFYEKEKFEKRNVRWTMKMSGSKEFAKTDILGIQVFAMPEEISEENFYLDIFINNTQIDRVYFQETGFKRLYYHIPGIKNHVYLLRTMANKTFNPYKIGLTKNLKHSRDQGVALKNIKYLTKLSKKKYKKINSKTILE